MPKWQNFAKSGHTVSVPTFQHSCSYKMFKGTNLRDRTYLRFACQRQLNTLPIVSTTTARVNITLLNSYKFLLITTDWKIPNLSSPSRWLFHIILYETQANFLFHQFAYSMSLAGEHISTILVSFDLITVHNFLSVTV